MLENITCDEASTQDAESPVLTQAIVGANSGLRSAIEQVQVVAGSNAPVLIFGETGTGKEVVARLIHEWSSRTAGPFQRVNCGAIPPELIDSELFGHERGSFTGAAAQRRGWFERADQGTLFLDEIGELPLAAQVRLLQILQDGIFTRVGGEELSHADVRVVAATHRDLEAMVADQSFRADLWYRLSVFPIRLPPLRQRLEDIPALVEHFSARAAARIGFSRPKLTESDLKLLVDYSWPGNIRELATTIERAVLLGGGKKLDIPGALGVAPSDAPPNSAAIRPPHMLKHQTEPEAAVNSIVPLSEAMRAHIEKALTATHGRVDGAFGAAALLRINPHTLRARMRKLGINWKDFRVKE